MKQSKRSTSTTARRSAVPNSKAQESDSVISTTGNGTTEERIAEEEALVANPIAKVELLFEKRIRNLEKRKQKLLQYAEEKENGKTLAEEQIDALSRLNDVEQQLEYFAEVLKTIRSHSKKYQKAVKKVKEREEKNKQEEERTRLAKLLCCLEIAKISGNSRFREALTSGADDAEKFSEEEVKLMETFFSALNPTLEAADSWERRLQATNTSAALAWHVLNGSDKAVVGEHSGSDLRNLLERLMNSESIKHLPLILVAKEQDEEVDHNKDAEELQRSDAAVGTPRSEDSGMEGCGMHTPAPVYPDACVTGELNTEKGNHDVDEEFGPHGDDVDTSESRTFKKEVGISEIQQVSIDNSQEQQELSTTDVINESPAVNDADFAATNDVTKTSDIPTTEQPGFIPNQTPASPALTTLQDPQQSQYPAQQYSTLSTSLCGKSDIAVDYSSLLNEMDSDSSTPTYFKRTFAVLFSHLQFLHTQLTTLMEIAQRTTDQSSILHNKSSPTVDIEKRQPATVPIAKVNGGGATQEDRRRRGRGRGGRNSGFRGRRSEYNGYGSYRADQYYYYGQEGEINYAPHYTQVRQYTPGGTAYMNSFGGYGSPNQMGYVNTQRYGGTFSSQPPGIMANSSLFSQEQVFESLQFDRSLVESGANMR